MLPCCTSQTVNAYFPHDPGPRPPPAARRPSPLHLSFMRASVVRNTHSTPAARSCGPVRSSQYLYIKLFIIALVAQDGLCNPSGEPCGRESERASANTPPRPPQLNHIPQTDPDARRVAILSHILLYSLRCRKPHSPKKTHSFASFISPPAPCPTPSPSPSPAELRARPHLVFTCT